MTAGRKAVSETKNWCTPEKYVKAVREVFHGTIDLDPCSNADSIVHATTEYMLPATDGLAAPWDGKHIYVNPPYGNDRENHTTIKDWFAKIAQARQNGSEIIALVPVATNTAHWKDYVYPLATSICFLYDTRLRFFINGREDTKGAPMSCCAIYYGDDPSRFADVFSRHGAVLPLANAKMPKTVNGKILPEEPLFNIAENPGFEKLGRIPA